MFKLGNNNIDFFVFSNTFGSEISKIWKSLKICEK